MHAYVLCTMQMYLRANIHLVQHFDTSKNATLALILMFQIQINQSICSNAWTCVRWCKYALTSGLNAREYDHTSVCVCYVQNSFIPTHFNVTKTQPNQRIQQNKFNNQNPHGICKQFQYSNLRKSTIEKLIKNKHLSK